jgi:hypothetical protein
MVEDYVDFASNMMLFPVSKLGSYGYDPSRKQYPLDTISVLSYLKSPLRRPTIIEKWSPLEIATFEAALCEYGKVFHKVQSEVATKTTREVIEFYYMWKKTSHYKVWKKTYVSPHDDVSDDELASKKESKK